MRLFAAEVLPEEFPGQCTHFCPLLVVGRAGVASFNVFVEEHIGTRLIHFRNHGARVGGVHAVVARGGGEEDRRVLPARLE